MSAMAEKILKIIAHAESTSHPEEAEAFMSKAHKLLEEHGLSLLDLGKLSDDAVGVDYRTIWNSEAARVETKITIALAEFFGCKSVQTKMNNRTYHSLAGRESARVTATLMIPFVIRQYRALANKAFADGMYRNKSAAQTAIGNALAIRIWDLVPAKPASEEKSTGVNALVPVDLIRAAMEERFPNLKNARSVSVRTDRYGHEQAAKVSLHHQAASSPATKRIK